MVQFSNYSLKLSILFPNPERFDFSKSGMDNSAASLMVKSTNIVNLSSWGKIRNYFSAVPFTQQQNIDW